MGLNMKFGVEPFHYLMSNFPLNLYHFFLFSIMEKLRRKLLASLTCENELRGLNLVLVDVCNAT